MASITSTAQRHTHFLDSPLIAASLERSDFSFREVAEQYGSVFLVLSPDRIHTYIRLLRLLTGRAIVELILDECTALGRMKPIEQALGLVAGYGVQLWTVFQHLHQLRAVYGRAAETFLSNSGIIWAFNVNDVESAGWISRTLGTRIVLTPRVDGHRGITGWTGRPLLMPEGSWRWIRHGC